MTEQRRVVILGSTGSIGTQAIAVAQAAPDRFRVTAICSGGGDLTLLADQATALRVAAVGVSREDAGPELRARLAARWPTDTPAPEVLVGRSSGVELAAYDADVVLNAIAGAEGLRATLASLDAGRIVALANKESLVAGGPWSQDGPSPVSSCRWTQNILRWPNACAAGARPRSLGSS